MSQKQEQFFTSLQEKLREQEEWPTVYMFKFIVPSGKEQIGQVEALFPKEADLGQKESSNGKYTSITATIMMDSPAAVIAIYKEAADIEGIVAL